MIKYLDLKAVNSRYDEEIHQAVSRVMDSGWYLRGEATRQFEAHYAQYIGTHYCIGCGNGLDALTLIFRAYKEMGIIADGDEVIVLHPRHHRKPTDARTCRARYQHAPD